MGAALVRNTCCEVGAPWVSFGGKEPSLLNKIADVLKRSRPETIEEAAAFAEIYLEFYKQFRHLVESTALAPGTYSVVNVDLACNTILQEGPKEQAFDNYLKIDAGILSDRRFKVPVTVLPVHLRMLKALYWRWPQTIPTKEALLIKHADCAALSPDSDWECFPAWPLIGAEDKRPYGDRTYYFWDLEDLGILEIAPEGSVHSNSGRKLFTEVQEAQIQKWHDRLVLVLQVILQHARWGR